MTRSNSKLPFWFTGDCVSSVNRLRILSVKLLRGISIEGEGLVMLTCRSIGLPPSAGIGDRVWTSTIATDGSAEVLVVRLSRSAVASGAKVQLFGGMEGRGCGKWKLFCSNVIKRAGQTTCPLSASNDVDVLCVV